MIMEKERGKSWENVPKKKKGKKRRKKKNTGKK